MLELLVENKNHKKIATYKKISNDSVLFFIPIADYISGKYFLKVKLDSLESYDIYGFNIIEGFK